MAKKGNELAAANKRGWPPPKKKPVGKKKPGGK